jgi:hypothetical protein
MTTFIPPSSTNPPAHHFAPGFKPQSMRRQIMKIHGMSRDPSGDFLYAVSFAKSKSFHYLTHSEMVETYPNYLIGFYERNLRLGDTPDLPSRLTEDLAKHPPFEKSEAASAASELNEDLESVSGEGEEGTTEVTEETSVVSANSEDAIDDEAELV